MSNSLEPRLKFTISDTFDLKVIEFYDSSEWKHLEKIATYIDITTPARKNPITKFLSKNKVTIYNSKTLELGCEEGGELSSLPDGLYLFKIYVCEGENFSYERYYLRTVKFMLELDTLLISMSLGSCKPKLSFLQKFSETELMIKAALANTRAGNIHEAMSIYNKALEEFKKLKLCADATNLKDL